MTCACACTRPRAVVQVPERGQLQAHAPRAQLQAHAMGSCRPRGMPLCVHTQSDEIIVWPHTHGVAQFPGGGGGTIDMVVAPPSPSRLARTWLGVGLGVGAGVGAGAGAGVGLVRGRRGPCARRATGVPRIAPGGVDSGVWWGKIAVRASGAPLLGRGEHLARARARARARIRVRMRARVRVRMRVRVRIRVRVRVRIRVWVWGRGRVGVRLRVCAPRRAPRGVAWLGLGLHVRSVRPLRR